eukprot:GEMP01049314.1.p1 GENE.GEMP01049314.1~~GEMP01049314.1.p1  ORF type:complete len:137 (+),score=20.52 GEMP01049314.1:58-411(+)
MDQPAGLQLNALGIDISQAYDFSGQPQQLGFQPTVLSMPNLQFQPMQFGQSLQNIESVAEIIPSTPFVFYATSVDDAVAPDIPDQPEPNDVQVTNQPKTRDIQVHRKSRHSRGGCCC